MSTYQIWSAISPVFANEILVELQKTNKKLYRTALEVMAPRMGVRVPILLEMPKVQRHATWVQILARPEMEVLSANLLSGWLISTQTALLCRWLDLLKIPHGENGCADSFPPAPSEEALKPAVDQLLKEFSPQLVGIYLRCFNSIDEVQWPTLGKVIDEDARLKL
jgi:hypothetical protein